MPPTRTVCAMTSVRVSNVKAQARIRGDTTKAKAKTIKGITTNSPMKREYSARRPEAASPTATPNHTSATAHTVRVTPEVGVGRTSPDTEAEYALIVSPMLHPSAFGSADSRFHRAIGVAS